MSNSHDELLRRRIAVQQTVETALHTEHDTAVQHLHRPLLQQDEMQEQRQESAYDRFFGELEALPPVPVAQDAAAGGENLGYKERKKRKKQEAEAYKNMGREMRLLSRGDLERMPLLRTKEGRRKWANEKLPHTDLTRQAVMKQILDQNDYSNFENLDLVMRNMLAKRALDQFNADYKNRGITPDGAVSALRDNGEGVSALLNPALRLGLSLAQHTEGITAEDRSYYQSMDEAMSTAVMEETLTHMPNRQKVVNYFKQKGGSHAEDKAENAIAANRAQQIQIAKRLLLMQLSNFQKIDNDGGASPWDRSMAVALSHCSRVVVTLPKQDEERSNAQEQANMWRAILTIDGENTAQDNSRGSSTHSIKRRAVGEAGTKEKKVPFNFIGQRGMNCAIGGLGNAGVSGKTLCNDGSSGHFYSMRKEADRSHYGAMLMGLESDANGVTNQMGHTHDWHATAEKASSLGAQRTDEIGKKYGGRQCDLSGMSALDIKNWMVALEKAMSRWQGAPAENRGNLETAMRMLSGKKMTQNELNQFRNLLGNASAG